MYISLFNIKILVLFFIVIGCICMFFYIQANKKEDLIKGRIQKIKYQGGKLNKDSAGLSSIKNSFFKNILSKDNINILANLSEKIVKKYRTRFDQAGWNLKTGPLIIFSLILSFLSIGNFLFFTFIMESRIFNQFPTFLQPIICLLFVVICFRGSDYFLDYFIVSRYKKINRTLPYAIDLLGICARAGLGLEKSFEKISQQPNAYGKELCKEFIKTSIELGVIPERTLPLRNLGQRLQIPIIQVLITSLIQAEEQGTSISQTLQRISVEFSKNRMLEVETKANKLPALMTLPLLLFFLPAIFIIILGPAVLHIAHSNLLS